MKLKFELNKPQIEQLYRVLQLVYQIWGPSERILFYFDTDQMIIYPEEKGGFDRVYARIHILNVYQDNNTTTKFFQNYHIKSQKEKCAILIAPQNLAQFLDNLKVLVDLNYDAAFKLTQTSQDNEIHKYIDIQGGKDKAVVRSFIEINCFFDQHLFPEQIAKKEVNFIVDGLACSSVLAKFAQRFNILQDDYGKICFKASKGGVQEVAGDSQMDNGVQEYSLELYSRHMKTTVGEGKLFQALFNDISDMKGKYKVSLKKDVFLKFFSVLKISGSATLKINHDQMLEMEYTISQAQYIQVLLETPSRNI